VNTLELDGLLRRRYSESAGNGPRYIYAREVRSQAGFDARGTADALVMDTWPSGPVRLIGHELKVSRADWLRELKRPEKAARFLPLVAEWWLAAAPNVAKINEIPDGWGFLEARGGVMFPLRHPPRLPAHSIPDVPIGFVAAMLRAVDRDHRRELDRARRRPFTAKDVPMSATHDMPYVGWSRHYPVRLG
jgi:hypothetical protein